MAPNLDFMGLNSDDDESNEGSRNLHLDAEADVDITSSLLPSAPPSSKEKGKGKGKAKMETQPFNVDEDDDEEFIAQAMGKRNVKEGSAVLKKALKGKGKNKLAAGGVVGGGSFQSMGLHPSLLRALLLRGYTTPTPIQRLTIPSIMASPPRDLVGMARTGSGKTLAYIVPLLQRLQGRHSQTFGAKAVILVPSRELALQILRVGKELARGWKAERGAESGGADDSSSKESIRWGLIVGGDSLDDQFGMIAQNSDVIIATPGRFLHLVVEMNLDLKSAEYVVFDEADRLFEMGFELQLREILLRFPPTRQTLLFSATLPKSLVEFAKAGLQENPKLVRLDAETKISAGLSMGFFSVKPAEKEAALLVLLREVVGVPLAQPASSQRGKDDDEEEPGTKRAFKKRKRGLGSRVPESLKPHHTIIFTATKHHVEYLTLLLSTAGYSCSHIYSSLDQTARMLQMDRFRRGLTDVLVVTDVAARGIDLPILENVINYDFPTSSRVFIHRVGRTARAGRKGYAWTLVTNTELPYLLDLQLFLGRPLHSSSQHQQGVSQANLDDLRSNLVLGTLPRDLLDAENEYIISSLFHADSATATSLPMLKDVVRKAQGMYERSQGKASQESYRRAKEMLKADQGRQWGLAGSIEEEMAVHRVFTHREACGLRSTDPGTGGEARSSDGISNAPGRSSDVISGSASAVASARTPSTSINASMAAARASLLSAVNSFRPQETVFEVGTRGKTPGAQLMKERRKTLSNKLKKAATVSGASDAGAAQAGVEEDAADASDDDIMQLQPFAQADEDDIAEVFDMSSSKKQEGRRDFRDPEFYLSYEPKEGYSEKGYSLKSGSTFAEQARTATFDLTGDDSNFGTTSQRPNVTRWDSKKKKFIKGDGVGSDNKKLIKTESGVKLPASFRSGRFDEWKKARKVDLPKVGETESSKGRDMFSGGRKYRHNQFKEAKPLDKWAKDYKPKPNKIKAASGGREEDSTAGSSKGGGRAAKGGIRGGRNVGKPMGKVKSELKSVQQIHKERQLKEKRRIKNARAPRRKGKK